jgi:dTDP-4-amino-4,6-dideoxygalactose transaminase
MRTTPVQLFVPTFDVEDCLREIRECLEKGWTGMGFKTIQFEDEWKAYTGLPNAHFLSSATTGMNLALEIMKQEYGWADGDEVITTSFTFISTNHAILLNGLKPVFADIDDTLCLDPDSVEKLITPKTRAVLFVGFGGSTGQYQKIVDICNKYELKLFIDAAHMAGTRLNGVIPGKEAEVITYSYQAVKNLPTADSGMLCFKRDDFDTIARKKAWLGITKDTFARSSDESYKWKYDVEYTGYKYHGNSIMAAIALAQLRYLDRDNAYRRQIANWYDAAFKQYAERVRLIPKPDGCESSQHLYQILVDDRDELLAYLNSQEIYPGVHYIENTRYRMYAYAQGTCPKAEFASEHILSLPVHLRLTYEDISFVADRVIKFITGSSNLTS